MVFRATNPSTTTLPPPDFSPNFFASNDAMDDFDSRLDRILDKWFDRILERTEKRLATPTPTTCSTECQSRDTTTSTSAFTIDTAPTSATAIVDVVHVLAAPAASDGTLDGDTISGAASTPTTCSTGGTVGDDPGTVFLIPRSVAASFTEPPELSRAQLGLDNLAPIACSMKCLVDTNATPSRQLQAAAPALIHELRVLRPAPWPSFKCHSRAADTTKPLSWLSYMWRMGPVQKDSCPQSEIKALVSNMPMVCGNRSSSHGYISGNILLSPSGIWCLRALFLSPMSCWPDIQYVQHTNAVLEAPLCPERHNIRICRRGDAPSFLLPDLLEEKLNGNPKYSLTITSSENGYKLLNKSLVIWRTSAVCILFCCSAQFQWKVAWLFYHLSNCCPVTQLRLLVSVNYFTLIYGVDTYNMSKLIGITSEDDTMYGVAFTSSFLHGKSLARYLCSTCALASMMQFLSGVWIICGPPICTKVQTFHCYLYQHEVQFRASTLDCSLGKAIEMLVLLSSFILHLLQLVGGCESYELHSPWDPGDLTDGMVGYWNPACKQEPFQGGRNRIIWILLLHTVTTTFETRPSQRRELFQHREQGDIFSEISHLVGSEKSNIHVSRSSFDSGNSLQTCFCLGMMCSTRYQNTTHLVHQDVHTSISMVEGKKLFSGDELGLAWALVEHSVFVDNLLVVPSMVWHTRCLQFEIDRPHECWAFFHPNFPWHPYTHDWTVRKLMAVTRVGPLNSVPISSKETRTWAGANVWTCNSCHLALLYYNKVSYGLDARVRKCPGTITIDVLVQSGTLDAFHLLLVLHSIQNKWDLVLLLETCCSLKLSAHVSLAIF